MLPSKTVFVLGAGASCEVGLPVGSRLKDIIAKIFDVQYEFGIKASGEGNPEIFYTLRQRYPDRIDLIYKACVSILQGVQLSPSIDDFIDLHRDNAEIAMCGKMAIARVILDAERSSKLFYKRQNLSDTINFSAIEGTWYTGFYRLISRGVTRKSLDTLFNNITVVSFNYDRCLEHYLVHAIASNCGVTVDSARELVAKLKIYRPYGVVGPYFGTSNGVIEFGCRSLPDVDVVLRNLRTYTEQIEDDESLNAIRKAIFEAEVLVFLGSAFHPANMKLITAEKRREVTQKRIFATRLGVSDADLGVVRESLGVVCGANLRRSQLVGKRYLDINFSSECNKLFSDFGMALRQ